MIRLFESMPSMPNFHQIFANSKIPFTPNYAVHFFRRRRRGKKTGGGGVRRRRAPLITAWLTAKPGHEIQALPSPKVVSLVLPLSLPLGSFLPAPSFSSSKSINPETFLQNFENELSFLISISGLTSLILAKLPNISLTVPALSLRGIDSVSFSSHR